MSARQCKPGCGVVKGCVCPEHGVMTGCARGRERSRNMIYRRGRIVVIGLVARHAGRARQIVVVVNVAIGTQPRRHQMRAAEREPGCAVVEGRIQPARRAVARVASLREIRRDVIRVRRPLEIGQMAGDAGRTIQGVVVVHVAVGTLTRRHCMQTGQREASAVVVEGRVQPRRCAVARVASLREIGRDVIRVGCALEIGQMASHAGSAIQVVVVVDVAIGTLPRRYRVQASQGEPGAVVIECRIQPGRSAVARVASLREVPRHVIRVRCALEVGHMAGNTGRAIQGVVIIHVAVDTLPRRHRVHAGQREPGGRVVKFAVGPQHGVMALLARCGEPRVWYRRGRCVEVVLVATDARRVGDGVVVVHVAVRTLSWRHQVCSG